MSDNWIVANLQNAFEVWNDKLNEIWSLVTTTPQNFKGGGIWNIITGINGSLQAIGYGLIVLFFAMSIFKSTASFRDFQRPEYALKHFIRFLATKVAGNVFADMLASGCVAVTRLDTVFRQSGTSRIALNAEKIRSDDTKLLYGNDFNFISAESDAEVLEILKHCYTQEIAEHGIDNVQVLAPFRTKGETSVKNINEALRELVNPYVGDKNELFCDGTKFRLNDRVIQLKNIDWINNGDVGFIRAVYKDEDDIKHAIIEFSDGIRTDYSEREMNLVDLAYATTIHKSQGCEYTTVIIPILMSQYIMLKRNLIYTAITRAKQKVILIGEKRALMAGIHKNDNARRNTLLSERIKQYQKEVKGDD